VSSYLSCVDSAMPTDEFPQADAGFPAGMIAVRAAGVVCPGGAAKALLVAGSPVASGEPLVFAHPVTVAPAVVRRSGAVQAGGWLPGHVRLGLLEQQLGDGVIEAVIDGAVRAGAAGTAGAAAADVAGAGLPVHRGDDAVTGV
jgi:hypothetical protein